MNFTEILNLMAWALKLFGAFLTVMGVVKWGEGHGSDNAADKNSGTKQMVGGAIIFVVGLKLVPLLQNFINY
ncbi:Maff2 family mobile element protein [uncultured Parvimonas sp.]|uniref:Maff2 family mobile element protein n=1 Tax=uncultured Parvimonas sp. TaxID=747372 RepID=UPI00061D4AC2|nr:Maff2 family protein [uncultured Parvimonas sp.]